MTELTPDHAERALADLIDNVVPTRGYQMTPLVGLGGSAGAIAALQAFFHAMPPDSGQAFVVILHLSPEHESTLPEILQRCTTMPVVQVSGSVRVAPDTVYVIPPGKLIKSLDGSLTLSDEPVTPRGRHVAVDHFFRTLADTHGPHAAAIVLSGADGDGAVGSKRIKERGGLTVAQDPQEAEHASMPRSAIATGMVDWVLPVAEMGLKLMQYFKLEKKLKLPPEDVSATTQAAVDDEESALRDVLGFLRSRTGRDFSCYKRATVVRRIARRMQVNGVEDLREYLGCLRTRPGEAGALLQDLLISVTNFFRDADAFEALDAHLGELLKDKGPNDTVRVWVAGCATGEEAYSIAILLSERSRELEAPPVLQIFATDLDEQAIKAAREGSYPGTIEADVSEERLRRYFFREAAGYKVRREVREMVLFAQHDLLKDSPFSRLDLISCRNLLIYLNRDAQQRVFGIFHFALVPQGRLFLGSSESVEDASALFSVVDKKHRIFMQRPAHRAELPVPMGPGTLALALETQQHALAGPAVCARAFQQAAVTGRSAKPLEGRSTSWGELHFKLLEALAPPSILVDAELDIVHMSASAGRFLQYSGGEPSKSLLRAVHPSLRIELRAALYQAAQTQANAQVLVSPVELGGESRAIAIRVSPVRDLGADLFIVMISDQPVGAPAQTEAPQPERISAEPVARHLERELERLKAHLRDTVEEYEASAEELKASNEELQAMNEELRSATEELDTSREELQSINEELTTVNQELKSKVDELSHANSDIHNLMDATAIATVFLDRDLRITRYTPSAVALFNLIATDVGRPLADADVVQAALESTRPLLEAAGHKLKVDLPAGPIELDADPLRLSQVLSNLLTNAIKFTPPGGLIRVKARLDGDQAVITVSDNGVGMEPGQIDRMFDRFTQARPADHTHGGLGIGLALVRSILQLHGGRVEAFSAGPGKGSEVRVTLPGARAASPPADAAQPSVPAASPAVAEPRKRGLILIADDNADAGWGIARLLEIAGFTTSLVRGGKEALREAKRLKPDVGIFDIGMPDLNGHDLARQIRQTEWGQGMVLIAATGWGQESDERMALEAGFDAHMTKPVDLRKLSATVDDLLLRRQR